MFGIILISVCTLMHVYVLWRVCSVGFVVRHVPRPMLVGLGAFLWIIFLLGRTAGHEGSGSLPSILEFLGMNWLGILFLIFISLLSVDVVTLFGFLMPRLSESLRGWALITGMILSAIAIFQGLRPPVIQNYEVTLAGLPEAMDGTVLLVLSDLHLGSRTEERWLRARIAQAGAQKPDLVVLLGDIFEGHGQPDNTLVAALARLSAPLGVWFVPGNHEFHGRGEMSLFQKGIDFTLLRNRWLEVKPGLVMAGVDDLTIAYRNGQHEDSISQALAGHPPGATILLSHTPWEAERASRTGVGLMLSGHTHGGQIWPFGYLVRTRYPLFEDSYRINNMTLIVCRGTGTWGPRMRLWHPSEMLKVTLRNKGGKESAE